MRLTSFQSLEDNGKIFQVVHMRWNTAYRYIWKHAASTALSSILLKDLVCAVSHPYPIREGYGLVLGGNWM
jgi:hypothetical protein